MSQPTPHPHSSDILRRFIIDHDLEDAPSLALLSAAVEAAPNPSAIRAALRPHFRDNAELPALSEALYLSRFPISTEVIPVFRIHGQTVVARNIAASDLLIGSEDLIGHRIISILTGYQMDGLSNETKWSKFRDEILLHGRYKDEWKLALSTVGTLTQAIGVRAEIEGIPFIDVSILDYSDYLTQVNNLKLSESKFKTLAENTPGLTKMSNVNNYYYYFNKNWQKYSGIFDQVQLSMSWIDFLHPDDMPPTMAAIDNAYKKRQKYKVEYRLQGEDGHYRLFEDHGEPFYDVNQFFMGYVSTAVDITDERELQKISQQLEIQAKVENEIRATIQNAQVLIIAIDKADRVVYANQYASEHVFPHDVLGNELGALFEYEIDGESEVASVYDRMSSSLGKHILLTTRFGEAATGRPGIFSGSLMYLNASESGDSVLYLIGEDITEAEAQRLNALEKEQKFQDVISSMQDMYFKIDRNLVLLEVNTHSKSLLGYEPSEILGKSIMDKVLQLSKATRRQILKNRSNKSFIVKVINKDGERLIFDCKIKPVLDPVLDELCFFGVAKDLTEILNNQQKLKDKNKRIVKLAQAKDQFLANMSHEIRTPLNGIIGLVDLLAVARMPEPYCDYVTTIKSSSITLLRIINDILDLSKLEAARFTLTTSSFSLQEVIHKVRNLYLALIENKGLSFVFELESDLPDRLLGDEVRLVQVLSNLISNAVKFTAEGTIRLRVQLVSRSAEDVVLEFHVTDTGIGIDEDKQQSIFKAFSQVDSSTTKSSEGTGLGLYISQQLAVLMGGQIRFSSTHGVGTTFTLSLPFRIDTEYMAVTLREIQGIQTTPAYNILLVDDNATNLRVGGEILRYLGSTVTVAQSGEAALQMLAEDAPYDLVLMDIQMPGMDGIQTLEQVRDRLGLQLPVAALTAYSMQGDKEKYLRMGFDHYLSKPITIDKMGRFLQEFQTGLGEPSTPSQLAPSSTPWVDEEVVRQLASMLGPESTEATYLEFQTEAEEIISSLSQTTNLQELHRAFHTLKGSAATVGLRALADLAYTEEKSSLSEDYTLDSALPARLEAVMQESITFALRSLKAT
ncbi:ATP-binding protein [Nostoc sp. NIES-2111]